MRDLTYPPVVAAAKLGFRLLGQRFDITGQEHMPRRGGVLLAFNHISYVDFIYGGYVGERAGRYIRFMAKRELFDHRLVGPVMRSLHHVEVDRAEGAASMSAAISLLRAGEAVAIFPEATISRAVVLKDLKSGAVRIAAMAGVPVLPVALWGTQRMLTKDHPRDLSRGRTIVARIGAPLRFDGTDPVAQTAELKAVMGRLLEEAIARYPADEQPPGSWWLPRSHGGSAPTLEEAAELDAAERRRRAEARRSRRR